MLVANPVFPFRWDITRLNQLGSLLETELAEETEQQPIEDTTHFRNELARCSAKMMALSGGGELYFVGRSLDSAYDYLKGILAQTAWANRLRRLDFSMFYESEVEVKKRYPTALIELRAYLTYMGLHPQQLAQRTAPLTFVDIVSRGVTLERLLGLLYNWCKEYPEVDWNTIKPKLHIVGITRQSSRPGPKHWRWQQHSGWVKLLETGAIKNVAMQNFLWYFLADKQIKVSCSYTPRLWGDKKVMIPSYHPRRLQALRKEVILYQKGCQTEERLYFAGLLAEQDYALRYKWFRDLLIQVRRSA